MSKPIINRALRRSALTVALGLCFASGIASAQSNATGAIFGVAPSGTNSSVVIRNVDTGFERTLKIDRAGRYRASSLPTGRYEVKLLTEGSTVSSRENVVVSIAGGTEVSFASRSGGATDLQGVTVTASAPSSLDVSSVDTRTVFYAEELEKLPVPRSVAGVALLAPSVVNNTSYDAPSFGGSASSENAYYINGYAVTNPLTNIGFTTLPFDGIDQMQVLTGGYGAEFGRSTGGVINLTTKRGTNEWKAGGIMTWEPKKLRASPRDQMYPDTGAFPGTDGTLDTYRDQNQYWKATYGAYVGGPIIKDKLFIYGSGEVNKRRGNSVRYGITNPESASGYNEYKYRMPRWMGKLDWNISDNHLLELTAVHDQEDYNSKYSGFSYADFTHDNIQAGGANDSEKSDLYIGKYTGYLTDSLTLSLMYGEQKITHSDDPWGYDPSCPRISGSTNENNQMPGVVYNPTCQFASNNNLDGAFDETKGGRFDIEYQLGDHSLRVGYDDSTAHSNLGSEYAGGYVWVFEHTDNKNAPIDAEHGVGSPASAGGSGMGEPGSDKGYFAHRQYYTQFADVEVKQTAQYIEDRWQATDNLLLSLGLRNEQFTNYNGDGIAYVSQRHQLAPRFGASWDVHGDSSLKLFANAGRYHLALPNNVSVRGAAGSLYTLEYFTYTGTDPVTGAPTGLVNVPVDASLGYSCPGNPNAISSNLECGDAPDPRTVAAKNMKSHFQDEYIIGMQQEINSTYSWGVKGTYRDLRSAIDDTCTPALGGACYLFNPGESNTFQEEQADGSFKDVYYSKEELGFPSLKRKYYAVDFYGEHRFTNNWYGKLEYTFSKNWGNTEGQLASDLDTGTGGQEDVGQTQDWDLPQLMVGANGYLPNHRAHQLKGFGYYQFSPEWRVGMTGIVSSGRPRNCTSYYPTADPGLYNGSFYYNCGLAGSGTDPNDTTKEYVPPSDDYRASPRSSHGKASWTYTFNLNVAYVPAWGNDKLTLQADVMNVFNQQIATAYNSRYATDRYTRSEYYGQELNFTSPRQIRLTARFDF